MRDFSLVGLEVLLYLTSLLTGFILGRITNSRSSLTIEQNKFVDTTSPISKDVDRIQRQEKKRKIVEIDEKTYVTDVTTNSLIKKGGDLGTQTTVDDDVGASVSRLAQLKKNK
jgi:hypothetical protein